jgi:hypothetical protein
MISDAYSLQDFPANPKEKFDRQGKKFGPPVIFLFERNLGLKNTIFVCVSEKTTLFLGHFPRIREDRRRKKVEIRPLFGPFCSKSAKNRPQNCLAAPLFIWPFLTYAAEPPIGQLAKLWNVALPYRMLCP